MSGQEQAETGEEQAPADGGQERAGFGIEENNGSVTIEVTGAEVNVTEAKGKRTTRIRLPAIEDAGTLRDALETFLTYHRPRG